MSSEWYQHNNIAVKLRDALDVVINGQGLPVVFAGLEAGKCTVEVVYNGETCVFYPKNPTLNDIKIPVPEIQSLPIEPAAELPEVSKRGRKTKLIAPTILEENNIPEA